MFRNGLGFEYSGGEYRKLIDVKAKLFPQWAIMCTGQHLSLLVRQLNLKVNQLIIKLSVLRVQVNIQIMCPNGNKR